ncbi:hypothetical protein PR003_g23052 [Phytophthora rubi]|uniref:START domain-containing protein n=1 Tax=Phytophthora rubi TaxID=129364 RepID=A0A6A3IQM2_9STRA|nr:hypothetical protein PR002_g22693 [Phytophthora rubi]KAE8989708.1 hypothetical protein PR001_g21701 [Phytophthora rubi]KAE9299235.1 hypothetical protein PR003_g23052 [Phytophthora rubi]
MSLNLVDDSEAFEAALHFVDEYVEAERGNGDDAALSLALDGLPSPTELALVDAAEVAPVSQSSSKKQSKRTKKSPKSTASKPNRPLSYNPNRAREQQRKELLYLREKVVEMEQELTALQGTRRPKTFSEVEGDEADAGGVTASSGFRAPDVWKEMASHQLEQRLKSERENRRLKAVLEGQIKIGKSLAKLLEATSTTQPMESCLQRTRRMHASAPDRTGPGIFAELMAGVDESYREVDDVFAANGLGEMESSFSDAKMRVGPDGVYMEIFANKVLPFDVVSTGTAAWEFFANSMEHMPFRFFYQKDPQNLETTDDTIVESFGMELHANGTQADFRVKQILRRYVEEDRVVIVWRSFIDPVEFSGAPLRGAEFREKGYIVVRRPRGMAENFALLQTYYLIHPETPVHSLSEDGAITGSLTDFVLSGTAANIAAGHQMIENILFNEAMKTHSRV